MGAEGDFPEPSKRNYKEEVRILALGPKYVAQGNQTITSSLQSFSLPRKDKRWGERQKDPSTFPEIF